MPITKIGSHALRPELIGKFRGLRALRVYTSSTTWTKPTGLSHVIVEVVGGGGAGGGAVVTGAGQTSVGQSAGAGGYAQKIILADALGASEVVTIGAGGAGVLGGAGGNGNTSSFGAHCSGLGGSGGFAAAASVNIRMISGDIGGDGVGGDINIPGEGANYSLCVPPAVASGLGGSTHFGAGGVSAAGSVSVDGHNGTQGGGGSGGMNRASEVVERIGGDGGNGIILVWEYGF